MFAGELPDSSLYDVNDIRLVLLHNEHRYMCYYGFLVGQICKWMANAGHQNRYCESLMNTVTPKVKQNENQVIDACHGRNNGTIRSIKQSKCPGNWR
jgi:hypothetical protein